jgi:hypothetical protein
VPTSILNAKKEEEEQFSLDVSQMDNYEQRAGVDIHKPDTIEVFDNDGGGNIYAFKKVKLATSYTGIIWLFQRGHGKTSRISLYNGPQLWLFCYDQEGKCMDFIKLFEKLSNSTCPSCSDYKACTLQKTTDGLTELWLDELHINPQSEDFWNKDNETMRIIKTHAYQITESGTFLQK